MQCGCGHAGVVCKRRDQHGASDETSRRTLQTSRRYTLRRVDESFVYYRPTEAQAQAFFEKVVRARSTYRSTDSYYRRI